MKVKEIVRLVKNYHFDQSNWGELTVLQNLKDEVWRNKGDFYTTTDDYIEGLEDRIDMFDINLNDDDDNFSLITWGQ